MASYIFRFLYPSVWWVGLVIIGIAYLLKKKCSKQVIYSYALTTHINMDSVASSRLHYHIFDIMRITVFLLLLFVSARPQLVDIHSNIIVEGIDIVLALDVSGSMQFRDNKDDKRARIDIAKEEAIRFVAKRKNDAIGLVIFGKDALSRCPLTGDKNILKHFIEDLTIGVIDPDGTLLARGLLTALNRLKRSKAKSKVIILLTDGEPSEGDSDPKLPIEIAQELGIKIYTIGIGSDEESYFIHPLYGAIAKPKINKKLLETIAQQTNGRFFLAHDARDMRAVYDTIDSLEKTEYESPLFSNIQEIYQLPLFVVLIIILFITIISTWVWYGL